MTTQTAEVAPVLQLGFGDRMRRLRISLGMNQEQFGDAIDLSGATVGKYELQGRTPRMGKVVASSVQLRFGRRYPGLDLKDWLLTGAEHPRSPESTDYATRARRRRGGLPEGRDRMWGESRPRLLSVA